MQVSIALKKRVHAKVTECMAKASKYYGRPFKMPSISFKVRGTTAGYARGDREVDFNAVLLVENEEDFIARTVPHECAHIIDYIVNPQNHERQHIGWTRTGRPRYSKRDVHGPDFRFIMERVLGADDSTRCHSYDVSNARVKKKTTHVWVCNDCGTKMHLGPKRHKKMLSGMTKYWMRECRTHRSGYSYLGVEGQEMKPMPGPKTSWEPSLPKAADGAGTATSHNRPTRVTTPPKGQWTSKKSHCEVLFDPNASRGDNISKFMAEAGCTKAGAATYYASIKKERG